MDADQKRWRPDMSIGYDPLTPAENLESTGTARDGTAITLRPILPDGELVLQDLFAHMSRRMCASASLRQSTS